MIKNLKVLDILISLTSAAIFSSIIFFIMNYFMSDFPKTIKIFSITNLIINFILSCYIGKYLEYKLFKKRNPNMKIFINKIGIPKIEYSNYKVLKQIADIDIIMPKIIFFPLSILAIGIFNNDIIQYIFMILGIIIGFIFQFEDIKKILDIWFKNNAHYIIFDGVNSRESEADGIKKSHKKVYFYEEIYKNYNLIDLKRELIVNEQNIENSINKGFWDRYIVPLIFIIATSMIGFYNGFWLSFSKNTKEFNEVIRYQFYTVIIIVILVVQILLFKILFEPSKKDLRIINLVLKNFIESKREK